MKHSDKKSCLNSVLVFGAKDHIGSGVVQYIHQHAPNVNIRVATHSAGHLSTLQKMFPYAEAVVADFFDLASLQTALAGMEGVFQISPDVFDEDTLVQNMNLACQHAGTVKHIIRILGTPPGATIEMVPPTLQKFRHYPAMQHLIARDLYLATGLPVTFVNIAGYYMDDFTRMFAQSILQDKTIRIAFDKQLAWIAPTDVADACAELLIGETSEYKGTLIDLTGQDLCRISQVADLLTAALGVKIHYDGNEERFYQAIKPVFTQLWGAAAPAYFVEYFKWETEHDHLFKLTPHFANIMGRAPKTFQQWAMENRRFFLDAWRTQDALAPA